MPFDFATASRIIFGPGSIRQVPAAVKAAGSRCLLVRGQTNDRSSALVRDLGGCIEYVVAGEPDIAIVRRGVDVARTSRCDVVIGIGGGSAIDAGKAIAALAANSGDVLDYLEVIGKAKPLERPSLPYIAIPTTAGTGSEVTRNAVLGSAEHRVKASLRSAHMLPRLAVVDPELTLGLPPAITAATGLDALTQLIEPYVSNRANELTDLWCREGMLRVARSIARAYDDGRDRDARADMSYASLLSGLCLANAGLGVVHGFAAPIGGRFAAPHGAVCAALLPAGMRTNVGALTAREPLSPALGRYTDVACLLTGRPDAGPLDGVEWVASLCRRLSIPGLSSYGVADEHVAGLVESAAKANSMKANPITLNRQEMAAVLASSL